jgi:hypothetical protein
MAASKTVKKQDVSLHEPAQMKKIAEMAYHLWEKRGRPHGNDMKDWLEAERIVTGITKWTPGR